MISHQEAEVLISARQDAPLDALVERELQAHLATCDDCRAFAAATEKLTAGVRSLPTIAANPRVKREVMERVRAGRNPLAGLLGGFSNGFQPGPAIAALALVAVIGIFGWFALDRLFFEEGDGNNQIAAVPTEQVTRETEAPTETAVADTAVPTEVAPTEVAPTEVPPTEVPPTEVPPTEVAPTEVAPTEVPPTEVAPTEVAPTEVPPTEVAPTEVPPTAVPPTEVPPTAIPPTAAPTQSEADQNGDGPTDLTTMTQLQDSTPEAPATAEPTEEVIATPTETEIPATPTEIPATPTETPATATETEVPVETPTETEVAAETPTETEVPPIEPMDGSTSVPVDGEATEETSGDGTGGTEVPAGTDANGDANDGVIDPIDGENTGDQATSEATTDSGDPASIELIAPDGSTETTPEPGVEDQATAEATEVSVDESAKQPLLDASVSYQGIAGDPAGKLGLTPDGRMEFMLIPDGASMLTSDGYQMQMADAQPGVVQLCLDGACEPSMEDPGDDVAAGWRGDVPLGSVDGTVYWMRLYDSKSEIYTSYASGTQLLESSLVHEIGPAEAPSAVYLSGSSLYTWLPSGEWLIMSDGGAQTVSGSFANPTNVRFAPTPDLIGYFSGGNLIVVPAGAPDQAMLTLPAEGVDFDISPPGDQVALIQGNTIVIYDMQGNIVTVYEGGDAQPGSVLWLNSGLVWVDSSTGQLYQIPETGN